MSDTQQTEPWQWYDEPVRGTEWPSPSAFNAQVGGNHYAKYAIQPTEFILANKLPFVEGNIIKYVVRWRDKGGLADLRKARHYIEILIEHAEKHAYEDAKAEAKRSGLSS